MNEGRRTEGRGNVGPFPLALALVVAGVTSALSTLLLPVVDGSDLVTVLAVPSLYGGAFALLWWTTCAMAGYRYRWVRLPLVASLPFACIALLVLPYLLVMRVVEEGGAGLFLSLVGLELAALAWSAVQTHRAGSFRGTPSLLLVLYPFVALAGVVLLAFASQWALLVFFSAASGVIVDLAAYAPIQFLRGRSGTAAPGGAA